MQVRTSYHMTIGTSIKEAQAEQSNEEIDGEERCLDKRQQKQEEIERQSGPC